MINSSKLLILPLAAVLIFGIASGVGAQTVEDTSSSSSEETSSSDLEVPQQTINPDSPFYFLKELGRSVKLAFTINKIKKAELQNQISNEKLVEIKSMADRGVSAEKVKVAITSYQKSQQRMKNITDTIKDKAENNPELNKFLTKFTNQQVLHERIMQKLEGKVPQAVAEKIKQAREDHLDKFQQVMTKLENNKDRVAEKINNAMQNGDLNDSQILEKIKNRMPLEVKQKLEAKKAEQKMCTQEYNPVCGQNGKTYSNVCMAKNAGVTIAYKGKCKSEKACQNDSDCPTIYCIKAPCPKNICVNNECKLTEQKEDKPTCKNLWWFDKDNKSCQQKQFCGLYMYQSLRTFASEKECASALQKFK